MYASSLSAEVGYTFVVDALRMPKDELAVSSMLLSVILGRLGGGVNINYISKGFAFVR
jgi:hypothetical protein